MWLRWRSRATRKVGALHPTCQSPGDQGQDTRTSTMATAENSKLRIVGASRNPGDIRLQIPLRQFESWNLNVVQNVIWFSSLCGSGKHRKTTHVQKKAKLQVAIQVPFKREQKEGKEREL